MGFRSQVTLVSAYNFSHQPSENLEAPKAGILFSALSVEAFLNDMTSFLDRLQHPDERLKALTNLLPQLEEERVQIRTKVQLAYFILSGGSIDKSCDPFQSYSLLVDLRNRLTHGRPPEMQIVNQIARSSPRDQKFIQRLVAAGAVKSSYLQAPDWESVSWNKSCSLWAYRVAVNMIYHLVDAIPDKHLRETFLMIVGNVAPRAI